ncbi:MAG: protease pro-enzyme activation domain-containing protein [Acidimicrobiales bacterium]
MTKHTTALARDQLARSPRARGARAGRRLHDGGTKRHRRAHHSGARVVTVSAAALAMTLPLLGALAATPASAATAEGRPQRLETVMRVPSIIARSQLVGRVSSSSTVRGAIGLRPRDEAALSQFIASVTAKGSPSFHRYLSRGEFAKRFGPSAATIAAVRASLSRNGLKVDSVSSNGLLVDFSGSASKVEAAFHTGLATYKLPNGTIGRATTTAVRLPRSISSKVNVVAGLDNLVHSHPAGMLRGTRAVMAAMSFPKAKASAVAHVAGAPSPCATAQADAAQFGGLTDNQVANAYGAFGLYKGGDTGQGQSIAVYELEPFAPSDISTFDQCYFGNTQAASMASRLRVVPVDGGQAAGSGSGEAVLDIEDVSALAPGANINVYEAPNTTFGGLDEYNQIVSADADRVVTSSWGLCETAVQQGEPGIQQEENAIFQQAAAQGQSVFAAAGDTGSNDCNAFRSPQPVAPVLSVDDPASQPYVVSVGGTTIDNATQPPQEHVWNDGVQWGAGGGGISNSWVMPSWQAGATVPGINPASTVAAASAVEGDSFCQGNADGSTVGGKVDNQPCREVPDVSAQADEFTGAVTVYSAEFGPGSSGWITIGGTSSATPIWAALLTDINASNTCQANVTTRSGVGFVSPLLYAVASNPTSYAASFNDITRGNNDIYGLANGAVFPATTGYDMASGLGSPQLTSANGGNGLAYYLCSYGVSQARPAITGISPSVIDTSGSGTPVTITGTGYEINGAPAVSQISMDNILVPPADYTVTSPTSISMSAQAGDLLPPTGAASDGSGPVAVTITLNDGETSAVTPAAILDSVDTNPAGRPVPAVTGVSAYGGPQRGGNIVTILGSGFDNSVDSVTFGGIAATSYAIDSPYKITATVPAYSAQASACATSLNPANDICQTQVVVSNPAGASQQYPILPAYEGAISFDPNGVVPVPPGCNCEVVPSPSEYDYFPTPTITSVSTSAGPASLASEGGTSTVTITGTGFNDFGIIGAFFGSASQASSLDTNFTYLTGTEMQITAPGQAPTVDSQSMPLTIEGLGGSSNASTASYSGVPVVSNVSPHAAPDTGGQPVNVSGNGFGDVAYAELANSSGFSVATDYLVNAASDTQATFLNPQQNPAIANVLFCTTSGCSGATPSDLLTIYPPGAPVVTSSGPASGPAHGASTVTISGDNLGCVTAVYFGKTLAASFSNATALLDCGSTNQVDVTSPPGTPGTTVPITLDTVESEVTGSGPSAAVSSARFTYSTSSPSAPRIRRISTGPDSLTVLFEPPLASGGSPVRFYVVRAIAAGYRQQMAVLSPHASSHRFTGLYWGTTWKIMVTAHNASGTGLSTTATAKPRKPKG